jgi:hypothetical protein
MYRIGSDSAGEPAVLWICSNGLLQSVLAEVVMLVFQFIAVLAATLFTGAAIYISLAEHPARMECGTAVAATVFGPSYRRAR